MNAHGAQLCRLGARGHACYRTRPHTGQSFDTLCDHAVFGAGADDDFLQLTHELHRIERLVLAVARTESAQIEDGVTDKLSRTVVGDIATAVDLEQLDAAAREFV